MSEAMCYYQRPLFIRFWDKKTQAWRTVPKRHEAGECHGDGQPTITKHVDGKKRFLCLGCLGRTDE